VYLIHDGVLKRCIMTLARVATLLFAPIAVVALSGCLDCDAGRHTRVVNCGVQGLSVDVSTAPALELAGPVRLTYVRSCLGVDEACSLAPQFTLGTDSNQPGTNALQIAVTLPPGMLGTFQLPSSVVGVSANLIRVEASSSPTFTGLRPQAGTVVIESSTTAGFLVTFEMDLATPGGQRLSLTEGRVELSGCHSSYICSD
jgi:hypothetical protein